MQRRTAQAAGLSVALHALLLVGVLLIRLHASEGPSRLAIVHAELLSDSGTWLSKAEVVGPGAGRTESPQSSDVEPPPTADEGPEPAAAAETVSAGEPPPSAIEASEHDAVASAQPDTTHDAVAPAQPEAENATVAAAEPSAADADVAGVATEAADASELAAQRSEPPTGPDVAPAGAPSDVAPADAPGIVAHGASPSTSPAVPVEKRERQMLAKRFASFTGKIAPDSAGPAFAWKQDGHAYTAVFRQQPSSDPMGLERIIVDVSTEQGGRRMSTQLTMTRLAFSNFAQFVDRWDPEVQIHDDEIDGRFHSNTEINLLSGGGASPVFRGKVTIASHDIRTDTLGFFNKREVFPEGLEMGVRRIMLPARFLPFLNDAAHGTEAVQRFERSARIRFYPDGTYGWAYLSPAGEPDGTEQRRPIIEPAHYLIGLEGATLRLSGTVKGKVLVYTAERIVIDSDLRYLYGRETGEGGDYLGLVAEKNVDVAEPDVTGPGDLEIHASIYARRQFAVREFRSRPSGTLSIYGSLTAGSITATEPRYSTKIEFDRRLENARPPSFPLTDRYELESWNGEWLVVEPDPRP